MKFEGLLIDLRLEILLGRVQFRNVAQLLANDGARSFFRHKPFTKRNIWRHFTKILRKI
jgi:hypothetical protein